MPVHRTGGMQQCMVPVHQSAYQLVEVTKEDNFEHE